MRRPLFIAKQAGHPSGLLGRFIGWVMSHETADANAKTLDLLNVQPVDHVLEVGFGHGRTIARAVALTPRGQVTGVEVSEQMVEMATAFNTEEVHEGRVTLQRTDGTHVPFPDGSFDRAYSVHTIYFWPDAATQLREIHRVLKPGGRLVITFRYGEGASADLPAPIYVHRAPEVVVSLLQEVGFGSVTLCQDPSVFFAIADKTAATE